MEYTDKALAYLKEKGPALPIDVASFLGVDTTLARAVLSELIEKGLVFKSKRTIGDSFVYYLKGQEDKVRDMIYPHLSVQERKLVELFKEKGFLSPDDLTPAERFLVKKLGDFLVEVRDKNMTGWKYFSYTFKKKEQTGKKAQEEKQPKPVEKQKKQKGIDDEILSVISSMNSKVVKIIESKKTSSKILISTPLGFYLFIYVKKKSITDKDISLAYMEAINMKVPVILYTTGNVSKKAIEFKTKNCGELVKIVKK